MNEASSNHREQFREKAERLEDDIKRMMDEINPFGEAVKPNPVGIPMYDVWVHTFTHETAIMQLPNSHEMDATKTDGAGDDENDVGASYDKHLLAVLLEQGYGIARIQGSLFDCFNMPKEIGTLGDPLFVVNWSEDPKFERNIARMGRYFKQRHVLLKPRGQDAFLIGVNDGALPEAGSRIPVGKPKGWDDTRHEVNVVDNGNPPLDSGRHLDLKRKHSVNSMYIISKWAREVRSEMEKMGIPIE